MAGYIGSKASVVSSGAERKKTFAITTSTTALTGLSYTPTKVHVFHNGVRLVDGTDYTATNSTSITLTVAAENGDQVVVVSYASFQVADAYTQTEADAEFVAKAGDTMTGPLNVTGTVTADKLNVTHTGGGDFVGVFQNTTSATPYGVHIKDAASGANGYPLLQVTNSAGSSPYFLVHSGTGNVGIGTTPTNVLHVHQADATSNSYVHITQADGGSAATDGLSIGIEDGGVNAVIRNRENGYLRMYTNNTERMRIDSSGNVLVGKTSANSNAAGIELHSNDLIKVTRSGGATGYFNRQTNDGSILEFAKDGTALGAIGNSNGSGPGDLFICSSTAGHAGLSFGGGPSVTPTNNAGALSDNTVDLGLSSHRFDDIYATNGTIQTSDRNEKQDIAALTATEMLVAARISGLFKTFRWIDSVADKGDNARTHTGVIAQDVQAAFIAEGLDAGDYALFTSATWWETQTDVPAVEADEDNEIEAADAYTRTDTYDTLDEAPDGATERTRMGIRYPELLAFVGSYNEQRFASIETRLAALEGN